MSKVYLEDSVLTDIADAIREKTGGSGTITPADMPDEIESISGGGESENILYCSSFSFPHIRYNSDHPFLTKPFTIKYTIGTKASSILMEPDGDFENLCRFCYENDDGDDFVDLSNLTLDLSEFDFNKNTVSWLYLQNLFPSLNTVSNTVIKRQNFLPKIIFNNEPLTNRTSFSNIPVYMEGILGSADIPLDWCNFIKFLFKYNLSNSWFSGLFEKYRKIKSWDSQYQLQQDILDIIVKEKYDRDNFSMISIDKAICNYLVSMKSIRIPIWCPPSGKTGSFYFNIRDSWEGSGFKSVVFENVDYTTQNLRIGSTPSLDFRNIGWVQAYYGYYIPREPYHYLITNQETYDLYKDNPKAVAYNNRQWSFYNHDSIVETINSLPDMTQNQLNYKTGTIQAFSDQGALTDGGAIGNLTAAEIAVATAKGWTITLS